MDKYIGKMLDNRYEILEIMGVGGMAFVYKARCHLLNRLVAIKILKDEFASDNDFRRRFHAESQAVAMLNHPNIVAVHDVSRNADLEYIVMELIDGITLKQYMQRKGALNWREGLHFVIQIVKALSHAHGKGIIHRDIKPHNIMILRDGSIKVADFGIARFASKQNTLTQEALGSVHYISPEQARGSHIDARSDIYSVGVVLYEMLTERLPFEGDSPVSVALQHINSLPLTPREINPEIPEALEVIIIKAMAPKLTRRYASAEDMLKDLEEFRKNPAISFEYDIEELTTAADEGQEEPTLPLPGGGATVKGISLDPRREDEERKRIRRELVDEENHKTRKASNLIAVLSAVLGVLVVIAVLGYVIVNMVGDAIRGGDVTEIEIPNFKGKDYTEEYANELLISHPLLTVVPEWESSDLYPRDKIFQQYPDPGKASKGRNEKLTVTVYVSLGKEEVTLTDLSGKDEHEAQIWLTENGLKYDRSATVRENHDTMPRGSVISTDPTANTVVYKGDYITLTVSLGKDVLQVEVPDLVGYPEEEARNTLSFYNLLVGEVTVIPGDEPAGTVLWQSVDAGEKVDENTAVDLRVSEGPEEEFPDPSDGEGNGDPSPGTDDPSAPPVDTSPSPADTSPSPDEPPEPVTVTVEIQIPFDKIGTTELVIQKNGVKAYEAVVNADDRTVYVPITGYPGDMLDIYFDGVLVYPYQPLVELSP